MTSLRREWNGLRAVERLREPREHHEVGVKSDALDAANAQRCEAVVVLEPSEFALHGGASTVEPLPFVRAIRDRTKRDRAPL